MRPVPPRPLEIPDATIARLARVRADAAGDAEDLALRSGDADHLAVVARRSVILGEDHQLTMSAIAEARAARLQWSEIAAALGLPHTDRVEVRNLRARVAYHRRRTTTTTTEGAP